uniref:Helicase SKI2W n=2 Tax=Cacopsylla melanoneura TaxID=428564 RepID=A0A8D8LJR2_9HEMI
MEKKEKNKKANQKGSGNDKNSKKKPDVSEGITEPKGFSKKKPNVSGGITEPKGFSKGKPQNHKEKKPKDKPPGDNDKPIRILANDQVGRGRHYSENRNSVSDEHTWENNPKYYKTGSNEQSSFDQSSNTPNSSVQINNTISQYLEENLKRFGGSVDISEDTLEIEEPTSMENTQVSVVHLDMEDETLDKEDQFLIDDLPPVFPDVEKLLEELTIGGLDDLTIHDFTKQLKFWKPRVNLDDLFDWTMASDATTLEAKRNPITGELLEFYEVPITGQELTAKNSMSWDRAPEPFDEENITGHSTNKPFWPGGFSEPETKPEPTLEDLEIDFKKNFLVDPPGYYGLNFKQDGRTLLESDQHHVDQHVTMNTLPSTKQVEYVSDDENEDLSDVTGDKGIVNLIQLGGDAVTGLWETHSLYVDDNKDEIESKPEFPTNEEENTVIPLEVDIPILKISNTVPKNITQTEWAEMLDVSKPVLDFDAKVPIMAHTWPFELDIFQKQAIIKLEEHNHVFVTAHTSAGKTVIAEYAIALSQNHKTRTIYTSPIKALSNQKYRDFRETFQDVGLVTGDFQINTTASCLVMTTEILRSMLYRGSDVLRDLEYVIFDEVHYINDSERGHVWEEVLILLPKEVCIVMLSATVPNTLEFADWVGNTKKTKVYVVSTLKRPVPLKHFMYIGPIPEKNQLFLIRDAEGDFLTRGYLAAKDVKNRKHMEKGPGGGKLNGMMSRGAEKNLFISFLNYLRKNQNLPVVIFTLSRKRCDVNAENLLSMDFTAPADKIKIHRFFEDSIRNLQNEDDRALPQVKRMEQLLKNGIGVHHSGILPILKEIVEMLFQKGLVKILFATETFAMGVNMPARTVAFDSIRKYDGCERRDLNPAEYIQMAGRAGRRGLDENGTVIIMCKEELPGQEALKKMMLGKQTKLESQFRLTYAMILNLMRVSMVNVEEMMSMSFKEFGSRFRVQKNKEDLAVLEERVRSTVEQVQETDVLFENFFDEAKLFFQLRDSYMTLVEKTAEFKNTIVPGLVLHIWTLEDRDRLGILLKVDHRRSLYRVLIFKDNSPGLDPAAKVSNSEEPRPAFYYQMLSLLTADPGALGRINMNHTIVNISVQNIWGIVIAPMIKFNFDSVVSNWELRQQPRFRALAPSEVTQYALQCLHEIYMDVFADGGRSEVSMMYDCLKIKNLNVSDMMTGLRNQRLKVLKHVHVIQEKQIMYDAERFFDIYKRKEDHNRLSELKHLLSHKGMSLYGDYDSKVKILQELNYINSQGIVQLKGNIACEMGSKNELLITELLFQNKMVNFSPEEIAALLSCLVFQSKSTPPSDLPESLKQGMFIITEMNTEVETLEKKHGVDKDKSSDEADNLNFGLVQVVYEWAMQKPFKDIMLLTDVQEGIIVRCIQQLSELLRSIKDGAKIFGERDLPLKMDQAIQVIKRDIVFAPSLYTT